MDAKDARERQEDELKVWQEPKPPERSWIGKLLRALESLAGSTSRSHGGGTKYR